MKTWTDAEEAALRKLLAAGKSFGQISKHHSDEIGGRSRCAIAGKCHRERLLGSFSGKAGNVGALTPEQVLMIRSTSDKATFLARRLGVSRLVIYNVRTGRSYRSCTPRYHKVGVQ